MSTLPIKVAFILGEGYSGSTLLDLILGSHSRACGLGEVDAESFNDFLDQDQLCTCLLKASECHFWRKVLGHLRELTGREEFRLGRPGGDASLTADTIDLFRAVREVSSAEILVDSSKRFERTCLLVESGSLRPKVIHLTRDGRGVAYSSLKRGKTFRHSFLQWMEKNAAIQSWTGNGASSYSLRLKYEELCARPEEVIRRVCDFLELPWEPRMMFYGQRQHHNVRGNTMRFLIRGSKIRLDETWRQELTREDLRLFEELAGDFSRRLGY
jgi:hypothetical protein